jgi:hypothetical protein
MVAPHFPQKRPSVWVPHFGQNGIFYVLRMEHSHCTRILILTSRRVPVYTNLDPEERIARFTLRKRNLSVYDILPALKLLGTERKSHVMNLVFDPAMALFTGLNVVPHGPTWPPTVPGLTTAPTCG